MIDFMVFHHKYYGSDYTFYLQRSQQVYSPSFSSFFSSFSNCQAKQLRSKLTMVTMSKLVQNCSIMFHPVPSCSILFKLVQTRPDLSRFVQSCPYSSRLIQTNPDWSILVQTRSYLSRLMQTGVDLFILVQTGPDLSKLVQTCPVWSRHDYSSVDNFAAGPLDRFSILFEQNSILFEICVFLLIWQP